ncbi:hypothetical protein TMEN_1385 [Trichophyton mentagrophytes]|nr:hypothetical protein TMEN_1385 [Trichophyton mentagrophytes]
MATSTWASACTVHAARATNTHRKLISARISVGRGASGGSQNNNNNDDDDDDDDARL